MRIESDPTKQLDFANSHALILQTTGLTTQAVLSQRGTPNNGSSWDRFGDVINNMQPQEKEVVWANEEILARWVCFETNRMEMYSKHLPD